MIMELLSIADGGARPELPYGGSLWSMLDYGSSIDPNHFALISVAQPHDHLESLLTQGTSGGYLKDGRSESHSQGQSHRRPEYLKWTYKQLKNAAASLANSAAFQNLNGLTVVTILPSCAEWALLQWVAALRCLTFVPLDIALLLPARKAQLISYIERLKPGLVVVENEEAVKAVNEAAGASLFKNLRGLCLSNMDDIADGRHGGKWVTMDSVTKQLGSTSPKPGLDHLNRTALILFTSGTSTGKPKGCPASVMNLLASTANNSSSRFDSHTVAVVQSANFRIISWGMSHNVWRSGGTVVIPSRKFEALATLKAIEMTQATHIGLVPIQMYMLAKHPYYSKDAVSSLRGVWVGGDIATVGLIQKTQETFPRAVVCGSYGMTEGLGAFGWPAGVPESLPTHQGIHACGVAMPGFKIRILDDEGTLQPRGKAGNLHISGDAMIEAYLDNENASSFYETDGESWIITGDIAVLDNDNVVYVLSRSKDVIKKGGTPITPASIQSCILEHLGIHTEIVGLPSVEYGELPYCVTEKPTKHDIEALILKCMGPDYALASNRGVISLQELGLSTWPLNATGKVVKDTLKTAALEFLST